MTDLEFEIMDELYFIMPFEGLMKHLSMPETDLLHALQNLIEKGWVKCLEKETDRELEVPPDFKAEYKKYNYLATKAGLLAHNSI
ncbi:MAG: transporter [Cytophagaceae bacterium]